MVIIGPQQGWQCPLCRNIYSPATQMCYSCSNQHNKYTTDTTQNSKVSTSIGVDIDPSKLDLPNGTITANLPYITTEPKSTVTVDQITKAGGNMVYTNQVFPDNPTEGHNINWPYEI